MDHIENSLASTPVVSTKEKMPTFDGAPELSGLESTHAQAYRVATQLYGANPPKAYVDQVEQGLIGKDI